MRNLFLLIYLLAFSTDIFASEDTVKIPLNRRYFHDKINNEQKLCDKADGKTDGEVHVSGNPDINLQVTDAIFRKTDELQDWIERNEKLGTSNEKIRYLSYIENMVRSFRIAWRAREIKPVDYPALRENFERILKGQVDGKPMLPYIKAAGYEVAKINAGVFADSKDLKEAQNVIYLKYASLNPDKILQTIRPYVDEPFADSLIVVACKLNPVQFYSYAQSGKSTVGKLIHRNTHPMVVAVAKLSQTPNALFYFPFLDDLLSGKKSIDSIKKYVGDGVVGYDSVGYYKLLVKTEIEYYKRMAPPTRDTPIAMFGANGLRDMLKLKAFQHFINPINILHDQSNLAIRMRAIDPLSPEELYFMMIMGEDNIYTSSYKHSFNRMLYKMGAVPRGDSLLQSVHFDFFKKFIKMAANFNKLDTFLKIMPADKSTVLMKAFVANLDKTGNLEDAVDVADSYSSINDKKLLNTILTYVVDNEKKSTRENNAKGRVIYNLLKTIFLSADSTNKIDLTAEFGIPSIYEIGNKELKDDNGNIVQQVFFYGDEDGKAFFPSFINSFNAKEWKITTKKEWVEIKSTKENVFVFANRPLDYNENLDDSAQAHLSNHLRSLNMKPSIVVHRGHSYWLPGTIKRMPDNAKIIVVGSCGGYQNLNKILEISPDAHIITTKEIGAGDINRPILNYINQAVVSGTTLSWKKMWETLTKFFASDPNKAIRESWDDYVPPYKNLGAIFLKAYNRKMEYRISSD